MEEKLNILFNSMNISKSLVRWLVIGTMTMMTIRCSTFAMTKNGIFKIAYY